MTLKRDLLGLPQAPDQIDRVLLCSGKVLSQLPELISFSSSPSSLFARALSAPLQRLGLIVCMLCVCVRARVYIIYRIDLAPRALSPTHTAI